jgi:transmembrane sensor
MSSGLHPDGRPGHEPSPIIDELEAVAADWIARRNGAGWGSAEERTLRAWLDADIRHGQAFAAMEASWALLNAPRQNGGAEAVWSRTGKPRRRQKIYGWSAATLAAAASLTLAFLVLRPAALSPEVPAASVALRPDLRTLPDGSTVELNLGAEIAVTFSPEKRAVRLIRGEALFAVAKNPARPFVVTAGNVEVRAVGTAFSVRHDADHVKVLVTEGRVAVERSESAASGESTGAAPAARAPLFLEVGRQVAVPLGVAELAPLRIQAVSTEDVAAALAWRDKRIEFTDTPLSVAVMLFNRQNRVQISIANEALLARRITGVFWADDTEGLVRLLETGFNIRVERSGDFIRLRSE